MAFKLSGDPRLHRLPTSAQLRAYGRQVPAYTMPEGPKTTVPAGGCPGNSRDLARSLWEDLNAVLAHLDAIKPDGHFTQEHFSH